MSDLLPFFRAWVADPRRVSAISPSGPALAEMSTYPRARVFHTDATRLARSDLYPAHGLGAAISGLPLLSMRPRQVMGVLNGAFRYLGPDGAFYQFTYGPRCPVPTAILDRMGLKSARIGTIVRNVPPSSVYRISRIS